MKKPNNSKLKSNQLNFINSTRPEFIKLIKSSLSNFLTRPKKLDKLDLISKSTEK